MRHKLPAITVTILIAAAAAAVRANVTFIGEAVISGDGTDLSGLPGFPTTVEDGHSPLNGLNGFGSGIAYAGGDTYYLLADRGPNKIAFSGGSAVDNTTSYPNRYQVFNLQFVPSPNAIAAGGFPYQAQFTNTATTLLSNSQGKQFLGLSTAFSTNPAVHNDRLDPEGIRVAPDGTTWISDEYGPYIYHFNQQGQEIGSLTVPASIFNPNPAANAATEASATLGRVTNKGAEGLAISPDGKTLVVAMQDPLIQDNGGSSASTNSINDRILVYDLTNPTAAPKQYLYQLDSTSDGISEILAVNNHQFLVDERNGTGGSATNPAPASAVKDLYSIDITQPTAPTDLTTSKESGTTPTNGLPISTVPGTGIPADVVPLNKSLFANITAILGASPNAFANSLGIPDKIEGYAWGPDLPDGRHLLLATNDNDFTQPGDTGYRPDYIFAFAVDPSSAPGFVAETFTASPVPEPASIGVLFIGGAALLRRRRK